MEIPNTTYTLHKIGGSLPDVCKRPDKTKVNCNLDLVHFMTLYFLIVLIKLLLQMDD